MDDKELAQRLKRHHQDALSKIIDSYVPYVSTIAYNIAEGSLATSDIEEITADVFVTLWNNADKLNPDKLKAYISCITKSRTKDKLRKIKPAEIYDISQAAEQPDSTDLNENFEQDELCRSLKEEIEKIKQPDREILIRYYYYYQKTAEIAQALHIKQETVKTKLQRTREKLKAALMERGF